MPFTALQHAPTIWPMRLWVALQDQSCRLRHCNDALPSLQLPRLLVTGPVMPFTALQHKKDPGLYIITVPVTGPVMPFTALQHQWISPFSDHPLQVTGPVMPFTALQLAAV